MLICIEKNCTCDQHLVFEYLKTGFDDEAESIIHEIENVNELADSRGSTLLHYAVEYSSVKITQILIDKGCDVNAQNESKVTPLMLAVMARDVETAEVLFRKNANIYVSDCDGKSGLLLAFYAYCNSLFPHLEQKAGLILEMFSHRVNSDFSSGTLLNLLKNANESLKLGLIAVGSVEIVRYILKNCLERPNSIDYREPRQGRTALHYAMILSKFENAKILIEHGANVDITDDNGWSPLHYYVKNFEDVDENSQVLASILKQSTSLYKPNSVFSDPAFLTDVENLLMHGKGKTMRTLLQCGITFKKLLRQGRSFIIFLAYNDNLEVFDVINELNFKLDECEFGPFGFVALMIAVIKQCPKRVEFFLQHRIDAYLDPSILIAMLSYESSNSERDLKIPLEHGAIAEIYFERRLSLTINEHPRICSTTKVIVAHLAMIAKQSSADKVGDNFILDPQFTSYFDLCTRQLEQMQDFMVHGRVTLFKILIEKEEKILIYVRNQELILSLGRAIENLSSHLEPYYLNALKRRYVRVTKEAELLKNVALNIEALTGLCSDVYYKIVNQIIRYLDRQDLHNLCQIDNNSTRMN